MARSVTAPVSAVALRWARETAGYPKLEDVIDKSPASLRSFIDHLEDWERDASESKPSVSQAQKLADFYRRPITDLYLQEIPEDMKEPDPPDFRRGRSASFSPNLRLLLRQARKRQKWAREFLTEFPESMHFFAGVQFSPPAEFGTRPDAEALGEKIRKWLKVDADQLVKAESIKDAREYWAHCAEARGIIVLQSHRHPAYQVNVNEFSGCSMADEVAPVVILNSGDSDSKRIFTLAHELAHLWITKPGISHVSFRADAFQGDDDEAYCNQIAAATLMPKEHFRQAWQSMPASDDREKIPQIVKHLKTSYSAATIRATHMEFITQELCDELLTEYEKYIRQKQAKKGGRAIPDKQALQRVGNYFARLTLNAYELGAISALDAGDLFGVKLKHLNKIAERLEFPLHRWAQ